MEKNKAIFNLDYEESVLLRSRLSRNQKVFQFIVDLIKKILHRDSFISATTMDDLKKIRDKANGELND